MNEKETMNLKKCLIDHLELIENEYIILKKNEEMMEFEKKEKENNDIGIGYYL